MDLISRGSKMKAIVYKKYGPPAGLALQEVEIPAPQENEVLIKLLATSLNASDWESLTGKPLYARFGGLLKPGRQILGSDIAGRVEVVGSKVTRYKPGDEVFGDILWRKGGLAEYVCAPENALALKPASMTFEQAAAYPQAALVALQALRDSGQIEAGKRVLINGAGGGMGTFGLQFAKWYGAEVTGVDRTEKLDLMRALGADHVIDHTQEDYTKNGQQYDLILDVIAQRSIFAYNRALRPEGIFVFVGGSMSTLLQALVLGPLLSRIVGKKIGGNTWQQNKKEDLALLEELFIAGTVVPVIDRTYPLRAAPEALRYLGECHARGKVVITIGEKTA